MSLPQEGVTEHLLIELNKPLIIESGVKDTIFVKFPIEVGVFLVDKRDVELIDLFTKIKPKYTLYGPPESGIICRWWKSDIFNVNPTVEKLYEGILKVDISNKYYEWVELTKMVFKAYDMKIFYGDSAYMRARLGLANCLREAGEWEEAIRHYQELLRLNVNDDQGVRYSLLDVLMDMSRWKAALDLLEQFQDENSATWLFTFKTPWSLPPDRCLFKLSCKTIITTFITTAPSASASC